MDERFIIDSMTWSFSRLNSFYNCPYEWYEDYILCEDKDGSAQTQFGTLMHHILEMFAKGELSIFDLSTYYMDHFNEYVTYDFPPNKYVDLREKYYEAGLSYLDNINLDLDNYEILGVEKEIRFQIDGYDFVGFIDLLLKDNETGEIIIMDHKSASIGILKSGGIAKKDREHFNSFKKQLYLYAKPVLEEYGHVDKLKWNLFKEQKFIEIPFKQNEYDDAIQWAIDTIKKIESETEWNINPEFVKAQIDGKYPPFYCMHLCSQRNNCPYRQQVLDYIKESKMSEFQDEMS